MAGTLLGSITGGRYQQSSDLPPLTQAIPSMFNAYNKRLNKALTTGGKNIFGQDVGPLTNEDIRNLSLSLAMGVAGGGPKTDDIVKLFRGVPKWFRGTMVRGGKHVGGRYKNAYKPRAEDTSPPQIESNALHTTPSRELAEHYGSGLYQQPHPPDPRLLEYHVPISKVPKQYREVAKGTGQNEVVFKEGLAKKYLKKVHKLKNNKDFDGDAYLKELVRIKSQLLYKKPSQLPKPENIKSSAPFVRNKNWWDETGDY